MKNKVIKAISLLTALVTLFSFAACGGNEEATTTTADNKTTVAADAQAANPNAVVEDEKDNSTEDSKDDKEDSKETEKDSEDKTTEKSEEDDKTEKSEDKTTKKSDEKKTTKKSDEKTTKKETTTKAKTYSKAEIVKICTDAINKAKKESPGYTKKKYQKLEGDRSAVPSFYNMLFGLFEEESTKSYKKGKADKSNFGVDGYVATKVSDPETITMEIKNNKYIINYTFGKETNPADLNSRYGRSMDIMTPEEVKKTSLGLISNITMNYYGGFLKAEIDIDTGRLIYMEMGSHVDADVNKGGKNPFTVKDIVSIATYTNFVW